MVSSAAWACIVKLRSDDDAPQSDPLVSDGLKSISVGSCFAMRSSAITCEKESDVRSENDSEEKETYLREDGVDQVLLGLLLPRQQPLPLLFLPQHERPLSLHHPLVQVRGAAPLISIFRNHNDAERDDEEHGDGQRQPEHGGLVTRSIVQRAGVADLVQDWRLIEVLFGGEGEEAVSSSLCVCVCVGGGWAHPAGRTRSVGRKALW